MSSFIPSGAQRSPRKDATYSWSQDTHPGQGGIKMPGREAPAKPSVRRSGEVRVAAAGIEPATNGLWVRCSATELRRVRWRKTGAIEAQALRLHPLSRRCPALPGSSSCWSMRLDSNQRPPTPKGRCATGLRYAWGEGHAASLRLYRDSSTFSFPLVFTWILYADPLAQRHPIEIQPGRIH